MLQLKIRELAEEQGWNLNRFQREAKITAGVARRYWYGTRTGAVGDTTPLREVNLDTIETIAFLLQREPSELFTRT